MGGRILEGGETLNKESQNKLNTYMVKINWRISQLKSIKDKETLSNCITTTEMFVWTVMQLGSSFDRLIVLEPDCTIIGCIFYFTVAYNKQCFFASISTTAFVVLSFLSAESTVQFEFSFTKPYFSLLSCICMDTSSSIKRGKIFS